MKTALITGASSGIGLEFAKIFAEQKHDLVLVARSGDKLEELAIGLRSEHGVAVKVIAADLGDMTEVQKVYDTCVAENIEIEYLVNNAGFGSFGYYADVNWDITEKMIDLNVKALVKMCRLVMPGMIKRGTGKILNVASCAAFQPGPAMAIYFATKSFVLFFSEAIYSELKGAGVGVTCLCPGVTESGFQKAAVMEEAALFKNKKMPTSKEVAEFGYKAMMKNKMTAIHGFINTVLVTLVRFSPRKLVLAISKKVIGTPE